MKHIKKLTIALVLAMSMIVSGLATSHFAFAEEPTSVVAKINDTEYTTLDEAVNAAVDGDTIIVLTDCTTNGLNLSKNLTIKGAENIKPTITFTQYGIALWGYGLTFEDCNVIMNDIGSTPYTAEWNWMTICASKNASLSLNNVSMTIDGANAGNKHAIYFCSNNKLNLNNSFLEIKNYQQDALEWDGGDGGYNVNIVNSTFISDNNRSGFTGTFYATIDNSVVNVVNSTGNGSNGTYYTIQNNSNVTFDNNRNWGISAWRIDMTNNSSLTATNNGYSGIWTRVLNVDGTCSLDVEGNGFKATGFTTNAGIFYQGNGTYTSTVEEKANVKIINNAGSGIYTKQTVCNLTLNAGTITNNGLGYMSSLGTGMGANYGGGVYNVGTMVLSKDVTIYNNHAEFAGDDIYNEGTITFNATGEDWYLDGEPDCKDLIFGWFEDGKLQADKDGNEVRNRWNFHVKEGEEQYFYCQEVDAGTYSETLALKAAHPGKFTVTVNYLDKETNEIIAESYTTESLYQGKGYDVTAHDKISIDGYDYVVTTGDELKAEKAYSDKTINVYYSKKVVTPTEPEKPNNNQEEVKNDEAVDTSDTTNITVPFIALAMCASALYITCSIRRKYQK